MATGDPRCGRCGTRDHVQERRDGALLCDHCVAFQASLAKTFNETCVECGKQYQEDCVLSCICPTCRQAAKDAVANPVPRPDKPPLGIMPEWLWKEQRTWELIACLARHRPAGEATVNQRNMPTAAWLDELRRLLNELLQDKKS